MSTPLPNGGSPHKFYSLFESLEERVLFDGVPDATFVLPTTDSAEPTPAQFENLQQSAQSPPRELIFVDASIENNQELLSSLLQSNTTSLFEIRILDQSQDGIEQISDALSSSSVQYDAIHILSHGQAGNVKLGASELNLNNINSYSEEIASWSSSFTEDADILFYGCELAGSTDGQSLIETISALTGADVAASDDLTGTAARSADWNLEFASGQVETLALSAANWQGTLAIEATDGAVTIQDAENSAAGTITLSNNGDPEVVTVLGTPTRVGQMLERVWTFNETADTGRATYVFDVSGIAGINATIAAEFGLIISDQADLADGPNTTTLVASGYDAANGLAYFHQVDLNDGDFFGLATEVVQDNFSINPTATGLEDTSIDLGLTLSPSLTQGGQLQDIIATDTGFRSSSAGTTTTDFFIPAGTTGIRITGFSTRDIGTVAVDEFNDDYQFLNASIDLGTETSNGYIGHIIDQGPARSDQFGFEEAPLGVPILNGGGTIVGDADDNINPTFDIVDGVLQITENHQLQTGYLVEFLTNATSSSEFIRTESAVLEAGDQNNAVLTIPADADFLVVNITDAAAGASSRIEYKGNSRVLIDLDTLRASGVVAAEQGETDGRVLTYGFEDYDVSSVGVGSILSAAGSIVGDTTAIASVVNDNQIYIDANGDLVVNRNDSFAGSFNSLITVEYFDRRDFGSSAEQLGEATAFGLLNSDPSNPTSTLEFDIPENASVGLARFTFNGTNTNDTNENSGAAFAVIDLENGTSSGSIYFVRASTIVDLVGFDSTPFGTAFFDDPNSISNHTTLNNFNDPFGGTATFNLINGGDTLEFAANSDGGGTQSFLDYLAGGQIEWFGAAPFEISGFTDGGSFSQGTLNPITGNFELTIADALNGLAYIPPLHVSGTEPVDVTLRIGDESEVTTVTVQAVIDPITFEGIPDACGDEDTDISISANVTPIFIDQDGSETLTAQVLSNIPIGHTLTDGTNVFVSSAANQSVDITAWDTTAITYRANPDESGTFTISLDADFQDVGGGVTDTSSVSTTFDVVVKPVNDIPVAVNDNYTVLGNTTLNVPLATGLLNNDSDVDLDTLTVTAASPLSGPFNGSVTVNSDGTFSYTPNTGYSGTDSFVYQVTDGNGGFATATAFIDVSEPVTGPLDAMDDAVTTNEETLINIAVMANDDLPTTGAFNIQSTTPPSNGSITVLPDGTIDYTPDLNFFGNDTFTYTLADASGRTSTATVTVSVVNVQDPPVANADSGSTPEDTVLPNIDILANDSDVDGDTLTVTTATAPNGTVVINPDGTIDYTPNPGFNGVDTVSYIIIDGNGGTASSTVQINVVPVADPPTSADNTVTTDEEVPYAFAPSDFAFADQDPGDSLVAVRIDTLPADGQLLINGNPVTAGQVISLSDITNGNLLFVPDMDDFGNNYTDFDFSVTDGVLFQTTPNTMTVNVNPIQDPPVATDNAITVPEDSTTNPLGLAPPTDVDGDALTATVTGLPTQGAVFLADGVTPVNLGDTLTVAQLTALVYDAPTTFTIANAGSFTYDISDGIDTDSGQVDITITPVNDPPMVDLNGAGVGEDYADTFTEGGTPTGITEPTVAVTDDDDTTFPLLKIDFDETTIADAGDEFLTVGGTDFQLDAATNSTTAVLVGGVSYDVTFTAATASFNISRTDSAEMTAAEAQAVLAATTYRNDSVLPTVGDRIFDVCVNDGDVDSNIATSTITVVRDIESVQFSITGDMMVIDGNSASYSVELSGPIRSGEVASVELALADVDTNSSDYSAFSAAVSSAVAAYAGPGTLDWDGTTLTFTSDGTGAMAPLSIALPTTPDGIYEGDEDYVISLANPGSTTGEDVTLAAADSVTTTIKDNTPAPSLMIDDGSAIEGNPIIFELSLDVPSFEDITFDLSAATGSATAGTDFETTNFEFFDGTAWQPAASGTQVTIPAGLTSLKIRIDSVQDTIVEIDETFTLSATAISGTVTSAADTGTGTIIDDDLPEISIDDVTVDEDNGTLTFTISLDQPPTSPLSVDFATASGTATSGVDFTATSGTANFAPGVQTQTVTVAITDDNIFEGPHSFDINLTNASGGTIVDGLGIGTIIDDGTGPNGTDDDRPVISIDDVTATEDTDPFAVFTISLSNPSIENTVVSVASTNGTAIEGTDFGPGLEFLDGTSWQPATGNITIAAGDTTILVRTAIIDDPITDSGETYSLIVTHVSGTTANNGDTGTGTILDEAIPDTTLVSITGPPSVTEGDSAVYTVAIDNVPLTDVTVAFTYSGTASGGTDYTGVASVTIPAGSTTATVTIPTIDDTLGEPLEDFTITINTVSGGSLEDLQIDPTNSEVTTDIIDDDVPAISVTDVIVTEGTDPFAEFTVELSNPTFENIDFGLTATGVTATGNSIDFGNLLADDLEVFDGTNYVPASSATFAPGVTTIQLRTPITDDVFAEVAETFTVTATVNAGATSNPSDTGTGTILDDTTSPETVLVSLTGPPSVVEGDTTTDYTLIVHDPAGNPVNAAEDVTITLAYTGVAIDGTDFTGLATVVIPTGSSSTTFTLPTVNDSLFEGDEDIIITIDSVTGGGFEGIDVEPTADSVTTLIIDDADIPTVSVNDVTSIEGTDNFAVYTIELSNLSVEDVNVSLALTGGTAAGAGVDFGAPAAGNLQVFDGTNWVDASVATIPAGSFSVQVRTPIVDDLIDEPTESYTLTVDVTAGTTTNIQVIGTGTIIDNDPAPDVTIDDATAIEGNQIVFNVTLSNPSSQPIVLDFAAADNTTSSAADYASTFEYSTDGGTTWIAATNGTEVTIPANSTSILVRTLTTEDVILESTETFDLSIASVVSGIVGNTTDTAVGTIIDDDVALVSITANDPVAGEPADDAQFTVSMTNPSDSPTTIAYSVAGTASSGQDFVALLGTITLPAGVTSGTIDVAVIDDLIIEGNEDVTITLTSIVSGDANISIDTANDVDTATIADDDVAQFQLTGVATVNEGAIASYQLDLNGTLQSGESAAVQLSIADNTTTAADYASFDSAVAAAVAAYAGPGAVAWDGTTLTFTSDGTGEMAPLVIDLLAINDAIVEGVEQYNVSITSATSTTGLAVTIDPLNNSVDTDIQDTIDAVGTALDKASFSIAGAASVGESSTTDYTVTIDATLQAAELAAVDIALTNVDTTAGDVTAINAAVNAAVATYNASGQPGSVMWDGTTLTFTSDGTGPMGDLIIQIEAIADGFLEGPEDYSLSLVNASSSTGAEICVDPALASVITTIDLDATAAIFSIGVDNADDEGATVQYTVALSEPLGAGDSAAVDLGLTDVDTNSSDYGNFVAAVNAAVAAYAGPGALTFDGTTLTFTAAADGDAMTDLVIDLMLTDDAFAEGTETFTVDLSNAAGPTGVNVAVDPIADSVTTTINDTMGIAGAPDEVVFSITGPATGPEGTSVEYVLELSGALGGGESVSVNVGLNDIDTNSADYASFAAAVSAAAATDPTVSFNAATGALTYTAPADGATMSPLLINLGLSTDSIVEGDEDFEIDLSVPTSSTGVAVSIDPALDDVVTTISDQTAPLEWAITGPVSADEGGPAQYIITLDGALGVGETATVQVALADLTTNPNDYADLNLAIAAAIAGNPNLAFDSATGTLTFTAAADGSVMPPIAIDLGIIDDAFVEGTEQFSISLSNAGSTTGASTNISATDDSVTTEINDSDGFGMGPDQAAWTITGDTNVTETGPGTAQYEVALAGQFGANEVAVVNLSLNDVDTDSSDYQNFVAAVNTTVANYTGAGSVAFDGTTITFTAAADGDSMSPLVIDLDAVDDTLIEGDEDYTVSISNAGSTTGGEVVLGGATSVTTTITDNDLATFSITGDPVVGEGDDAKYILSLTGTLQADETATIDLSIGNTDTTSADYASFIAAVNTAVAGYAGPGTLAFNGTTLTFTSDGNPMDDLCIELTAIDDVFVEGPEDFTVSIANPGTTTGSAIAVGGTTTVTTTITDNDAATFSLTGDATVGEGADAKYILSLAGTLQADETATIELTIGNTDTTSADYANFVAAVNTAVADYAGPGILAFNGTTLTFTSDGSPMDDLCIELTAIDDVFVEGPEDFTVSIANPGTTTGSAIAVGGTTTVTTTITDNDTATFSITGDPVVGEGDDAKYIVALAGTLQAGETATIDLSIGNTDTTSADYANFVAAVNTAVADYAGPGMLAFNGTTLTFTSDGSPMDDLCIELTAIDDVFVEGPEDFTVSIAKPGTTTGSAIAVGGTTTVTTTITDNDAATFSLTGDATVGEGADAKYILSLAGTLQADETATIELTIGNTDTTSADYASFVAAVNTAITNYSGPGTFAFDGTTLTFTSDGNPMEDLCIELAAIDDILVEGPEDYTVSIANPGTTTGSPVAVGGSTTVTTTITDNDTATFNITGDANVVEGADAKYVLALTGTLQAGETATIDLSIDDVSTNSTDYANFVTAVNTAISNYSGPGSLAFNGTTLTFTSDGNPMDDLCIELTATDDALIEGSEAYTVSIANPATTTGSAIAVGGSTSVTTTITDNDTVTFTLLGDAVVAEGADAKYVLALTGTLQAGETATIDLSLGDVDTNSADYANFVAAVNTATANYTGSGTPIFNGTTLTFISDGNPMDDLCIELTAIDDVLIEGNENYTVSIANPGSTTGSDIAVGGTTIVNTTITDNDTATFSLTGDATVGEGAAASYTVSLTGTLQSGENASIDLALSDIDTTSFDYAAFVTAVNTAIAGRSDLAFDGTTLTYTGDGNPMADLVIDLTATDDTLVEGDEDYSISIANPATATGGTITTSGPTTVTTTITDNDTAIWSIVGDTSVDEGGTAQYTIALDGILQTGETAVVELDLADIETNPLDHENFINKVQALVAARPDLTFDPATGLLTATGTGVATADLVVDLDAIDDAFVEGPERYQIMLSNPGSTTGAASSIDPANSLVTTIINDTIGDGGALESAVWALGVDQTVPEGTPGAYTLTLSGNLQAGEIVTVDLEIFDIDTIGTDYADFDSAISNAVAAYAGPGTLAWDGTTITFTSDGTGEMDPLAIALDTIDDSSAEGTEDFLISLSNANSLTGAATSIDATSDDAVTTIDDTVGPGADDVTFAITGDTTVDEGGTASYTVTTVGGLAAGQDVAVNLLIDDVDTNSADYAPFSVAVNAAVAAYNSGANPGTVVWDGTTLTFTATNDGDTLTGLFVDLLATDDAFLEGPEVYDVSLSGASSAAGVVVGIDALQNIVFTTINDTDGDGGPAEAGGEWSLVGGGMVNEGDSATFLVGLTGNLQAGEVTSVQLSLSDLETTNTDYGVISTAVADAVAAYNADPSNSGSLTWDGMSLTFTSDGSGPMSGLEIMLDTIDDAVTEGPERFNLLLSNPSSTTGLSPTISATDNIATTTIIDNDSATWSISGDVQVDEGATAQYTVALSGILQSGETATVDLGLVDVDTTSADYAAFVTAVTNAVAGRTDLAFDGTTLTYTGDGFSDGRSDN